MPDAYDTRQAVKSTIDILGNIHRQVDLYETTIGTLMQDKQKLEELIRVSEIAERVTQIEGIADTAASEDKSVIEWVTDVLADAVLVKQKAAIYVEPEIVDQFAEIATARGVAVAHITQSKKTTKYIETGFKNYVY